MPRACGRAGLARTWTSERDLRAEHRSARGHERRRLAEIGRGAELALDPLVSIVVEGVQHVREEGQFDPTAKSHLFLQAEVPRFQLGRRRRRRWVGEDGGVEAQNLEETIRAQGFRRREYLAAARSPQGRWASTWV